MSDGTPDKLSAGFGWGAIGSLLVYAVLLLVVAVGVAGGGHGFRFPLVLFFAPLSLLMFGVPWDAAPEVVLGLLGVVALWWPLYGCAMRAGGPIRWRVTGRRLLYFHYGTGLVAGVASMQESEIELLRRGDAVVSLGVAFTVYAFGQVMLWTTLKGE